VQPLLVQFRGLTVQRSQNLVISNVDFHIRSGEIVSMMGPSGVGKTTLLRTIVGGRLEPGSYADQVVFRQDLLESDTPTIGYMPQDDHLFPWATAYRNIEYSLQRERRQDRKGRILRLAERLGIPCRLLERYPHELSGGERRRVALARAISAHPKLLLLDEPFSSLDPALRITCREFVVSELSEGSSCLLITHDIEEAVSLSDRIVILGGVPAHVERELVVTHEGLRGTSRLLEEPARQVYLEVVEHFKAVSRQSNFLIA